MPCIIRVRTANIFTDLFTVIEAATEEALRNRKGKLEMRNAVAEINKKAVIRKIELFGSADKA